MNTITLTEYKPCYIPRDQIPQEIIDYLKNNYKNKFRINLKYSKKGDQWEIVSQGWIGYIPINNDWNFHIKPKVHITNIFKMLEYAYNLKSFQFLDGLMTCDSLPDFYNRLATIFARLILKRTQKGLYSTYIKHSQTLSYVKGKIDVKTMLKHPWKPKLTCHYDNFTQDIEDNQILLWTIYVISRQEICQVNTRILIRKVYGALQGYVTLSPSTANDCINRKYNRLNEDYRCLHSLCRFFLENTTPSHKKGNHHSLPFLVNMNQLYEKFVAAWLKKHLPPHLGIKTQHRVEYNNFSFKIDLIIYNKNTNQNLYVLDTKYKTEITQSDIYQIITYTFEQNCNYAIIITPTIRNPINDKINNINIRSLNFFLDEDIEAAGNNFLEQLMSQNYI
ncbi:McrC family protein [Crocosphaera chwakensis]|uniref:Putative restriction enzyme modulator protein n=1 Tax=Crocosphaera chwakensis CCY0110 TaxID=391612 RepID=A3ILD1_9CHRO|nr:restriction endonuclease [Crocosphaera chwakensis]EAZ92582.1 putative restriction enzyme modulator protein [Crocosphaera chwakensis CCY0110]